MPGQLKGRLRDRLSLAWIIAWIGASAALQPRLMNHELVHRLGPSSFAHPFGFDAFGRDVLLLTLHASMTSLLFALLATLASCLLALFGGSGLVLLPKGPQFALLRILDGLLAFPSLLFALLLAAVLGPGWVTLGAALLVGMAPGVIRLVYVRSRELLAEDYILAAKSLGSSRMAIMRRHLFPAAFSLCAVKVPNLFAHALVGEATLTFLGIGAPYGSETWGSLLAQGKEYLIEAPHIATGSGLALVFMTLSLQVLAHRLAGNRTQV